MKSQKTAAIEKAIQTLLKPHGFKRKGSTWYLPRDKYICLINLQRSSWGDQYYINTALYIKELGPLTSGKQNDSPMPQREIEYPKEYKSHIQGRLDDFMSANNKELFRKYLDFEDTSMTPEEKIKEIISAIEQYAIPFFFSIKTLDDIKRYIEEGRFRRFSLLGRIREFLGIKLG